MYNSLKLTAEIKGGVRCRYYIVVFCNNSPWFVPDQPCMEMKIYKYKRHSQDL
jgi:hypothetical protein